MPWKQSTDRDYFVDDPQSPDYNRWVQLPPDRAAFRFAEVMRRTDDLYEFGIVVQHNMAPVQPGAGSAIFLHVWSGPESSTAGCTAMDRANLLTLLPWLDPAKEPLLVIAPEDALPALRLAPDRVGP
jgi:L,D-peptidoglycan transpeptidase YkuD (ErfK/YbiS/YcfS/YnhG family)